MIERSANLPTFFMSSPWPAMPTTSVLNKSGTINDLIMRRKMLAKGLRFGAKSGASQPMRMPITIEIRIQAENPIPRKPLLGAAGEAPED